MGKVQLSDHEKGVIDGMHRIGTSTRTIAKSIGRSNRTVSKWIARLKALGHMERQDGSGCPRKTTALQDRRIMLVQDITVGEIQESAEVKHISETTIRRRIKESGEFDFYRTIKKPYVNAKNRRRRVLFAKEHLSIDTTKIECVYFFGALTVYIVKYYKSLKLRVMIAISLISCKPCPK